MGLCEIKFEQKYFSNKEKQWCTFNKVSPPLCSHGWCLLHITKNIVFISQITLKDKLYHQRVSYKKLCLTFSISTSKLEFEGLIFLVCAPITLQHLVHLENFWPSLPSYSKGKKNGCRYEAFSTQHVGQLLLNTTSSKIYKCSPLRMLSTLTTTQNSLFFYFFLPILVTLNISLLFLFNF